MWQGALVRKLEIKLNNKAKKNQKNKQTPSVLAVSPTLCALQLYRITLFTSSTGSTALCESGYISLQNNHIKTHISGNLTLVLVLGGVVQRLKYSSVIILRIG